MSEDCKSDAIGTGRQTDDFCPVRWRNIFHRSLVEAFDTRLCILHRANPAETVMAVTGAEGHFANEAFQYQ